MRLAPGDEVTVIPADWDPYILQFQRFATVSRTSSSGAYVRLKSTYPPNQEFGPIPATRLLPGWRDDTGRFRSW